MMSANKTIEVSEKSPFKQKIQTQEEKKFTFSTLDN